MMVDGITQKQKKSRAAKIFSTFRHFPTETFIFFKAERDYPSLWGHQRPQPIGKRKWFCSCIYNSIKSLSICVNKQLIAAEQLRRPQEQTLRFALHSPTVVPKPSKLLLMIQVTKTSKLCIKSAIERVGHCIVTALKKLHK